MNKFSHLIILVISLNLSAQKNKVLKDSNTEFGYLSDTTIGGNLTVNGLSNLNGQVTISSDLSVDGSIEATAFIGDGSQLTNLASSSPFSLYETSGSGIQDINANASGSHSFAMGDNANSSGFNSRALGINTTASGDYSTAVGYGTTASGTYSTAMGRETEASGMRAVALGGFTIASGWGSIAMGTTTEASGRYSTTIGGWLTQASDRSSLVIGELNYAGSTITDSAEDFSTENTAFVIGNGTTDGFTSIRSDALVVKFNGDATFAGNLNINSDARLKANIISLGSTLAKLLQIDGKSYTMKKDENKKQKIGLLAQDIEKVFPELVSESNGIKSVNYQGLVPVLINALKEQDSKMKKQEERIKRLEKLLLD
ncbi:MAG: tail fiber domain-containing protein [Flavobacteriaceae bacterium]